MQDKNRFLTQLLIMAVIWLVMTHFLWPKNEPAPAPATSMVQQAQQREAEANDPKLSRSDRLKKLQTAIDEYRKIYQREGKSAAGIDARYQELRLLDQEANLEQNRTDYYDQAENLLKDMEANLAHRSATVVLAPGKPPTTIPDVGKDASNRLAEVRAARDRIHRTDIRYMIMDWLVAMTGRQPAFSYWFALLFLTLVLKAVLWPFTKKTFTYMRDMQRVAPMVKDLQEKMKGRPPDEVQKRLMALYKEHNVSPAQGCIGMILQMVVLIPVYSMVRVYEYQFSKG